MQGALFIRLLNDLSLADLQRGLRLAAPVLALAAFWSLVQRLDAILDRLFPHWEWERELGWFNIRAERQAEAILRWLGHIVHALLALALYGLAWSAETLPGLDRWSDPVVWPELAVRLPVLVLCLGVWLLYLGGVLLPKLRRQRETASLARFRAEQTELERERGQATPTPSSRLVPAPELPQPRTTAYIKSDRLGPGQ